jgi:hypothetical protein
MNPGARMASDETASLRNKAREWQAEADIGVASMRSTYQRMADTFTSMADAVDQTTTVPLATLAE